jgi:hypothetical protein
MKNIICLIFVLTLVSCGQKQKKETEDSTKEMVEVKITDPQFFEIRTYYCHPGKLPDLLKRFNDHTMELFEKHGMVNMGYWVPMDNADNKLVYLMGYESHEQRDTAWDAFMKDPEWNRVWDASKVNGPIVASVVNKFYTYTGYSPKLKKEDAGSRIFSLRTYYTNEGKLNNLHNRFKDHTLEIFKNNGMTNIAYFNMDPSHEESKNVLTYLITFPDTTARKASWDSFREDEAWKAAYANSIKDGSLVDSLTAELLMPTSFSPLK